MYVHLILRDIRPIELTFSKQKNSQKLVSSFFFLKRTAKKGKRSMMHMHNRVLFIKSFVSLHSRCHCHRCLLKNPTFDHVFCFLP